MTDNKRKHEAEPTDELYSNKSRSRPSVTARLDPTYGQRSAIPVDEEGEEDGDIHYDEEMDALAYLKSVRREAGGIPHLLVAPKSTYAPDSRDIYEDGLGDYRGRYEDGAFYAKPASYSDEDEEAESHDPQNAYFSSILARFHILRERLQQTPPLEALQKLDEDHPIYLGALSTPKVRWWRWKLGTTDPLPAQVASMDKETVLGLLKLVTGGTLLRRGWEVEAGVSRWVWSLLAKLPERGELSSEEIGIVRELGKKAVLVAVGIREGNKWDESMQEVEAGFEREGGEDGANEDEIPLDEEEIFDAENEMGKDDSEDETSQMMGNEVIEQEEEPSDAQTEPTTTTQIPSELDELAAAKARILEALKEPEEPFKYNVETEIPSPAASDARSPTLDPTSISEAHKVTTPDVSSAPASQKYNSNATVDMILTIAGEVYGQRDLLEFRGEWGDIE